MHTQPDTIVAIATAPGVGGIAIVRISGPDALPVADRLFQGARRPSAAAHQSFIHGHVCTEAEAGETVDEAILLIYRAPHSYTCEDVVEIQGHGGRVAAARILRSVLAQGVRPADPGEFTRRAFINGRIDLLQAEAVADLVAARSERAAGAAMEQLDGRLSEAFDMIYRELLAVAADCEAVLDFGDDELPEHVLNERVTRLHGARERLEALLSSWEEGHLLRDGARVVIVGLPNVGKSTLMNILLGRDRAIVSEAPGTTRDTIEEELVLEGIPIRLTDTAGLRDTACRVEREGISRAEASLEQADITLYMVDGSASMSERDRATLGSIDGRCIVLINKADLGRHVSGEDVAPYPSVLLSLTAGTGLDALRATLLQQLGLVPDAPTHATVSERHRLIVQNTLNVLNNAIFLLQSYDDEHLAPASSLLRTAIETLSEATGAQYTDALLDAIFSRFCIGK